MSRESKDRGPATSLSRIGRWVMIVAVLFQLISSLAEFSLRGLAVPFEVLLVDCVAAVASLVLLWWPWVGLGLGVVPLGLVLLLGAHQPDFDFLLLIFLPAVFISRYGLHAIVPAVFAGSGYALLRGMIRRGGFESADLVPFAVSLMLFGMALGFITRAVFNVLGRRETRLIILAEDIAEIRGGERLRLAEELRRVVGTRLAKAREAQKAPRRTIDVWVLLQSLEGVRSECSDAVGRVRALVGMLREDPVADGEDESIAIIGSVQILAGIAEALRRRGNIVVLIVSPELDRRSLTTQMTIIRLAKDLMNAVSALQTDQLRITVDCKSRETWVLGEFFSEDDPRPEDLAAFERIRERVEALGGVYAKVTTGRNHAIHFTLPDSGSNDVDSVTSAAARKKTRGYKIVNIALPLLILAVMACWTCLTQPLGWSLVWPLLGYLGSALMLQWPLIGGAVSAVAVAGMFITPEQTPFALAAVGVVASWKLIQGRNPYWVLLGGLLSLSGTWILSMIPALTSNSELVVGISIPFVGLLYAALNGQYQKIRERQDEQAANLIKAIEAARTEERNLLARELHDVLAHHFSVILLQCMAYEDSTDVDEVRFALDQMGASLEAAEGELLILTDVMSDAEMGDLPALMRPLTVASRLQNTLTTSGFRSEFTIDPKSDDLPQIARRTLTRAMQEGVTNIIRYADPGGMCVVDLVVEETIIRLRVCNDMPEDERESELSLGYGLAGIRERVDLSGGTVTVGPEGNQWVVSVELPNQKNETDSLGGPSDYMH